MKAIILALALAFTASPVFAETKPAEITVPEDGSISRSDGLEAFARIYEVASHPRCANCHVGEDGVPMWSGDYYGGTFPHGMNVNAGESRMGIETLPCGTCHRVSEDFAIDAHAPPRAGLDWRLPPPEFQWFGKSPAQICAQLSDPDRNGGRTFVELAEHLVDDAGHLGFVLWGWEPGGDRAPAPHSLQQHVNDVLAWGAAGMPCPES